MLKHSTILRALALALSTLSSAALFASGRPEVIQELDGFTRPTVASFSPDGASLFVINHAQGEAGTLRGQSFLSKLKVDAAGSVAEEKMRFVEGLTAPIDLDFSPVRLGALPSGSIFMVEGTPLVEDEQGRALKDMSRVFIGLTIVDPSTGSLVKKIDLSPNARFDLAKGTRLLAPSCMAFDKQGNLFIGESGVGGHMFAPRQVGRPGIWRISRADLVKILAGEAPLEAEFIRLSSLPVDLCYREAEGALYFVSNHTQGVPSGSVFKIEAANYQSIESMQTVVRGLSALSGIQITPKSRVLMVGNNGDLMFPKGKKNSFPVRFRPQVDFSTPGKIGLKAFGDDTMIVAVPEQSSDAGSGRGQRLRIVRLPDGY